MFLLKRALSVIRKKACNEIVYCYSVPWKLWLTLVPLCDEARCCLESCAGWLTFLVGVSTCNNRLTSQKLAFVDWKCLCTSEAPIEH